MKQRLKIEDVYRDLQGSDCDLSLLNKQKSPYPVIGKDRNVNAFQSLPLH